ncbi:Flagellar-associated PapD-like, putative [Trypanosoma equiperdum]|uniref:Flagellar-associated PapD-like, putative n=1 Tax=Trypanosoma equiperdum TaxID=5694 RepID=A0A1G4HYC1_TRYEQ|nr:Flagellar-associated PapD-like, putative [Trypanosoma equiperdum]
MPSVPTANTSAPVASAPVDPELQAEALKRFNPLVFAISVETPKNVCVPRLNEAIMRDPVFAKCLYVLDTATASAATIASSSKQRNTPADRRKQNAENVKSVDALLYDDYVRFAVEREVKRRAELKAREAERDAIAALYIEDGLSKEEAIAAAEQEMEEAEAADGASSDEGNHHESLFVFLRTCPHSIEEVLTLKAAGVCLHAVISISSRVPLSGSVGDDAPLQPSHSAKGRARRDTRQLSKHGKDNAANQAKLPLAAELRNYIMQTKQPDPCLKNICIHSFQVPTEVVGGAVPATVVPTAAPADGGVEPPVTYKLKDSESAVFGELIDAIMRLEDQFNSYCEWKRSRVEANVPTYIALKYPRPTATAAQPVEKDRRRPSTSRKKLSAPQTSHSSTAEMIPLFDDIPKSMEDVTAHREVYKAMFGKQRVGTIDWKAFRAACLKQVEFTSTMMSPELLSPFIPLTKREELAMLRNKEEAASFVRYMFSAVTHGAHAAFQNRLRSYKIPVNTRTTSKTTFETQTTSVSSMETLPTNVGFNIFEEVASTEGLESDVREVIVNTLQKSFSVDAERAKQLVSEVVAVGVVTSAKQSDIRQFLRANRSASWRSSRLKIGEYNLEIFYRGDRTCRTESCVYAFRGGTTFSEYVDLRAHCSTEELYYHPPPPDSDAEESSDEEEQEEEEEEEEEEEDEDDGAEDHGHSSATERSKLDKPRKGKRSKDRKKSVEEEEVPSVDVVDIAETALRRRCVYEDIMHRISGDKNESKVHQELLVSGQGACCVSQEVQWMFTEDGCAIEVRRTVANTRHVDCCVSDPGGLLFGFLTEDAQPLEEVPAVIPCGLRCYFIIVDVVQFFFEVVADNSDAVSQMKYDLAVKAAKDDAKAHRDMLESIKPPKNSKEKVFVPPLSTLEEEFISRVPVPVIRGRRPPAAMTTLLLKNGTAGTFSVGGKYLRFSVVQGVLHTTIANLVVDIWDTDKVRTVKVNYIEAIEVLADGCAVVYCPELVGYRLSLDVFGNYVTMDSGGTLVRVEVSGKRTVVMPSGEIVDLGMYKVASTVDVPTGKQVLVRQDGLQVTLWPNGRLDRLLHSAGFSCTRDGEKFVWHIAGFPDICVTPSESKVGFTYDHVEAVMDIIGHTLRVLHHRSGSEALLDWKSHRLHVKPMPGGDSYTIDCAFGGLVGHSKDTEYCVSTLGRCGESREDVFKLPEIISETFLQFFNETLPESDMETPRWVAEQNIPCPLGEMLVRRKSPLARTTTSSYRSYAENEIDKLVPSGVGRTKDVLRAVVWRNSEHCINDNVLFFGNLWLSKLLTHRLKAYIDLAYLRPLACAALGDKTIKERVLFLQPPKEGSTARGAGTPFPRSISDFLLIPCLHCSFFQKEERERDVLHVAASQPDVPFRMSTVAELLCHERLALCEEKVWEETIRTLPPSEASTLAHCDDTGPLEQLRDHSVCEPESQRSSLCRGDIKTHKGRFNYWASSGIIVAAENGVPDARGINGCSAASSARSGEVAAYSEAAKQLEVHADDNHPTEGADSIRPNGVPFMHTRLIKEMPPQERISVPTLSVTPTVLDFGLVEPGYRYVLPLILTNTSTYPCRHRITFCPSFKKMIHVNYRHQFLAPGLTIRADVELLGTQPPGPMRASLCVAFETGSVDVEVRAETAEPREEQEEEEEDKLPQKPPEVPKLPVVLLGPSRINTFIPASTHRLPLHHTVE